MRSRRVRTNQGKTDPNRYQRIPHSDREAFFSQLGEQAETEIQQLQDAIAGPDRPAEDYLEKVGRLNMARLQAEERVLQELILIAAPEIPEEEEEEEEEEDFGDNDAPARHLELARPAEAPRGGVAAPFRPPAGGQLAPSGQRARVDANLQALRLLRVLEREQRPASGEEQRALAAWPGWGAEPQLFDEQRQEWDAARQQLRELAGERGYEAARRTTINAYYTDPAIATAIWQGVRDLGFTGGRVLEPGCGAGIFLGLAAEDAELTGVELDPTTAAIARALYPHATIRAESFAATRLPDRHFDLAIGNVPFADVRLHDPRHNAGGHSLHNHFILKSLALTRPGGLVAVLTSHYTFDAANPAARREMSAVADLVAAVRLPTGAHRRAAGTDALMDLLILRRRERDQPPRDTRWETTRLVDVDGRQVRVNTYLADHPELVLG